MTQQSPPPTGSSAPSPSPYAAGADHPVAPWPSAGTNPQRPVSATSATDPYAVPTSSPGPAGGAAPSAGPGRSRDVGFFAAMFDFSFQHFITVRFSSFLYVLAWIVAVLVWGANILFGVLWGFVLAGGNSFYGDGPVFTVWPLVVGVLLGWIPSVIAIIVMRLALEFSVATIRTAQNTEDLAARRS